MIDTEKIKKHMTKNNITVEEITFRGKIAYGTVRRVISGENVSVKTLEGFARGIGLEPGQLFSDN